MFKKISATLLLMAVSLLAIQTKSIAFQPPVNLRIKHLSPLKLAQPIPIYVGGMIEGGAESTLDLTLSDGLQLLSGDLHKRGEYNGRYTVNEETLVVQIIRPGTYEISAVLNASQLEKQNFVRAFPDCDTLFFYAREDTVVSFRTQKAMDFAIQNSLICSEEEQRRVWARKTNKDIKDIYEERAEKNLPPVLISNNLVVAAGWLRLSADTLYSNDLPKYFDTDKAALIKGYELMYAPPRLDIVEVMLEKDFHGTITSKQMHEMVEVVTRQLQDLYDIDQQILKMPPCSERKHLLWIRKSLLENQTKERQSIIKM